MSMLPNRYSNALSIGMKIDKVLRHLNISREQRFKIFKQINHKCQAYDYDLQKEILEKASPRPNGTSIKTNKLAPTKYDLKVIVPAFNAEQYIERCLSSILNQKTQFSFRIVVIDDGSIDNTGVIIDEIAKSNPIIEAIHQENRGFSGSRTRGLEVLDSNYVMFVDSDDSIEEGTIESLVSMAYHNNSDIVEGGMRRVSLAETKWVISKENRKSVNPYKEFYGYPVGKVYRSSLFQNVVFPENYWFEDTVMMYRVWNETTVCSTVNKAVYSYFVNNKGITSIAGYSNKAIDSVYITELLIND